MIKLKINGEHFHSHTHVFSGGEVQLSYHESAINAIKNASDITFKVWLQGSNTVIELLQAVDIVRQHARNCRLVLDMAYAPYARQDRVCAAGESLAAKVFANIVNSCNFDKVYVADCHSDVLPALINNCHNISVAKIIKRNIKDLDIILDRTACVLVSPDAGANKKVLSVAKAYGGLEVIRADKVRNTATGEITDTEVYCDDLNGAHCVIIDDICDGGYTFVKLAEKLKEKGAGRITLYVTHGIFSKGIEVFDGLIDKVYTTNSFNSGITDPKLKTYVL